MALLIARLDVRIVLSCVAVSLIFILLSSPGILDDLRWLFVGLSVLAVAASLTIHLCASLKLQRKEILFLIQITIWAVIGIATVMAIAYGILSGEIQ